MTRGRRPLLNWAQIAGLLVTAYVIWVRSLEPRLTSNSLANLLSAALTYALIAWACAAVITFCILVAASLDHPRDLLRTALRTSTVAMWFAPAVILLSAPSLAAFTASLVLVANTTRLLIVQWVSPHASGRRMRHVPASAFGAAVLLQAGWAAYLWRYPLLAAAFIAGGAAVVTALALLTGAYWKSGTPSLPVAFLSVLLTLVLAIALLPGGAPGQPGVNGSADSRPPLAPSLVPPPRAQAKSARSAAAAESHAAVPDNMEIGGGDFPGVVLLAEPSPQPMLVAPPALASRPALQRLEQPLSFPFTGDYWIFRPPAVRPPPRSILRRGSPLRLSFHTTDGAPLDMQARQVLARPIDPLCCEKLRLTIANADRYPGTISLEVILSSMHTPGSQSLGKSSTGAAARDTLEFPIPAAPSIPRFDQIGVVFHRDRFREDRSAKIQIERFVLLPRQTVSPLQEQLIATLQNF